jgi:hypothetical protein
MIQKIPFLEKGILLCEYDSAYLVHKAITHLTITDDARMLAELCIDKESLSSDCIEAM